jgi:hypothetical protein
MRVATIVVFVSVLTSALEASQSCMSKTEARQHFGSVWIYWHGKDHCWDATPGRRHHQIRQAQLNMQPKVDQPKWRNSMSKMLPDAEPARAVTQPMQAAPWTNRWVDIEPPSLDARWVDIARLAPPIIERTRATGHAARRDHVDHNHRTGLCVLRCSVRRQEIG